MTMSSDVFGADGIQTEGAVAKPPPATGGTMTATSPAPGTSVAAVAAASPASAAAPTMQQAADKAIAKAESDHKVSTDPHAVHHVKVAAASPKSIGATSTGAVVGFFLGGPPGAAVGAGVAFVAERYQIGGGLSGLWDKAKEKVKGITSKV